MTITRIISLLAFATLATACGKKETINSSDTSDIKVTHIDDNRIGSLYITFSSEPNSANVKFDVTARASDNPISYHLSFEGVVQLDKKTSKEIYVTDALTANITGIHKQYPGYQTTNLTADILCIDAICSKTYILLKNIDNGEALLGYVFKKYSSSLHWGVTMQLTPELGALNNINSAKDLHTLDTYGTP